MRVLLYDSTQHAPVSPLFLEGLRSLESGMGISIRFFDENDYINSDLYHRILRKVLARPPFQARLNREFLQAVRSFDPDLILVVKGAYLEPSTFEKIQSGSDATLVNYATDDPFNPRSSTDEILGSIPLYDYYACTKRAIIPDVKEAGCENAFFLRFAYKPSVHFTEPPKTHEEQAKFTCDLAFVGAADEDRVPIIRTIIKELPNIDLKLYGGFWNRYPDLRKYHEGIVLGRDYRMAIGGATVSLNLVRRANRDGHVMRTFEVPACGGAMLCEETEEHGELFEEDEVQFFQTEEELVPRLQELLNDPSLADDIASRGHTRITQEPNTYADRLWSLLGRLET